MPRLLHAFLLFGLFAAPPAAQLVHADTKAPRAIPIAAASIAGKVVGVHDGDSLTLYSGSGPQLKIRLDGIDAPELKQAFGAAAKRRLSGLVFGKQVLVVVPGRDSSIRIQMVRLGAALDKALPSSRNYLGQPFLAIRYKKGHGYGKSHQPLRRIDDVPWFRL